MALSREWSDRLVLYRKELERQLFRPIAELQFEGFTTRERLRCDEAREQPRWPMQPGDVYGEKFGYAWFFSRLILPPEAEGRMLALRFDLGGEGLVYVDGVPFGTNRADRILHEHHHFCDLVLTDEARPGQSYEIAFEAYAGDGPRTVLAGPVVDEEEFPTRELYAYTRPQIGHSWCGVWNEEAYQLCIDLETLVGARDALPEGSMRVMEIDEALRRCIAALRLEDGPAAMQASLREARALLAPQLQCHNGSTAPQMYAFGHSHLDLAWLWTKEETARKCGRTFSTQLRLMDRYPDYVFLQSQPYLYEQTKQNYPELYARIKEKVQAGQFVPEGGMWVEADSNMPSGESLIRQFLYGKKFFRQEFGVENEFLWLPDVFGYSAAMPQIMQGCGIRYFSTQKLGWAYNDSEPFPYNCFYWQGIDGSRVLTFLEANYGAYTDAATVIRRYENRYSKDGCRRFLYPYGYGDGGAGPTRDHIENLRRLQDLEGVPRCEMTSPNAFFHDVERDGGPADRYVGELYFAAHRGVYTSQAAIKQGNRKCELALRETDIWTALLGAKPDPAQEELYKKLLFNQFHDVLPGSGIAEVYAEARADYAEILQKTGERLHALLDRPGDADAITVFNALSWPRQALVALPAGWNGAEGPEGLLPAQRDADGCRVLVTLPAFGAAVLRRAENAADGCALPPAQPPVLENDLLRVELAADGSLARVYDKQLDREWLSASGNRLRMYRDIPRHFDAWDIDSEYIDELVELTEPAVFTKVCRGPLFTEAAFTRAIGSSRFEQTIRLEPGSRQITFETKVHWQETHKLLKVEFPFALHAEDMLNEIQYGYIRRPTHGSRRYDKDRYEVCNHRWSAIVEEDAGAAVLNDSKYGISGRDATLALSLLRAPKAPDFHADVGDHAFTYAVCFWSGPFAQSPVVPAGYELNCPPTVAAGAHPLPGQLTVEGDGVVIDMVKPAEDGDGIILRAYQSMNRSARARFRLAREAASVEAVNFIEEPLDPPCPLPWLGDGWQADFTPFQVRTFRVRGEGITF